MRNLLELVEMRRQQHVSQLAKVAVSRIVNFDNTPWILSASHASAIDNDFLFASDNRKWKQRAQFVIIFDNLV
jgi:hypothetical protein